jgi:cytochrome c oxidase subunit 2
MTNMLRFLFNTILTVKVACNDAPQPWQIGFQDGGSPSFEGIIELHDQIMFYLIVILLGVGWMLSSTIRKFNSYHNQIVHKYHNHGTLIELIWTITPALVLIAIAFPSFKLLYLLDEVIDPVITVKAIGNQWFWSYEYSDYVNDIGETIEFDSYMVPDSELEPGQLRLLEVDNRVILPVDTHIRLIITARDVIHSFAVPSLGLKLDALPGRLNQTSVIINREGVFYGMCSELCGIYHFAMPIVIEAVSLESYLLWLSSQNSPLNPTLSLRASWTKQLLTFPTSRGYHTSTTTPRLSRAELKARIVTPEQHEVIIGSLLGDMCATRPKGNKRNTRLFFGQSESNAAYLQELFTQLSTLIGQQDPTPTRRVDKITGKLSTGFEFFTRSLPCLNLYREWFYPEGVKIVPNDIDQHLTARGVAHWFMQDGSKTTDNGVTFATHCFSEAELQLLIQTLSTKFGLNCTLQKKGGGKDQKAIYVRRASIPTFIELVSPHMHSSMLYKLPTK